jgi:oxalate decarboxylase
VGLVPRVVGHYIEDTGDFQEISLNNWIRRLPPEMVTAPLKPTHDDISKISADPGDFIVPR